MTYATYISQLRSQSGDTKRRVHVDFTGDGSTVAFQLPIGTFPVYEDTDTYTVAIAAAVKTEGVDYTFDKGTGLIIFTSAPSNGAAITVDCYAVYLSDADWLLVINNSIKSLGKDFFKEFVDETLTTTAGMLSLSLTSAQPNCIGVYEFWYRRATTENWVTVETYSNWRHDPDNNKIYISDQFAFPTTGHLLKIRGIKTYTLGTATTDTIDVQDRFLTIVELGAMERYYKWRYQDVIELVSKESTENSRTPLQELMMLADRFHRDFEVEKARLKPQKPSRVIPRYKMGSGRP